uniref:hypothetical protein n=1 Tax=Streptomyces sp. F12 TaxID=1436084 RepID=UPI0021AC7FF6|nr:hypothetical protein [Streptomyces sp. F12]
MGASILEHQEATVPAENDATASRVLAVNVSQRWSEVEKGTSSEADVVLGDWSPWSGGSTSKMLFDPDEIAVVVACRRGQAMAVYDVVPNEQGRRWDWVGNGPRRRIVFHGQPSRRYDATRSAPAPTWRRGEGTPVKLLDLDVLLEGTAQPDNSARHVVLGEAVVRSDGDRRLTVSVPPGYSVTVHTRTDPADRSN